MSDDVECPYCEHPQDINHDDGRGYSEDELHQQHCTSCGKAFAFTTSILYVYEAYPAECLNDGEHKFSKTHTNPIELSKMRCEDCGEEREMTAEERKEFGIGTKEELFKRMEDERQQRKANGGFSIPL